LADDPPLLTAGTGVDGARLCRLTAGRRSVGAIGCGKYGDGCRHTAMTAGSRETAAGKEWADAGRRGTAADKRRQCRHIRQTMWGVVVGTWILAAWRFSCGRIAAA